MVKLKQMELKKVDPYSIAKVQSFLMAIMGFILAIVYGTMIVLKINEGFLVSTLSFVFILVILPLLYGLIGFVIGLFTAAIYNFIAKKIGGVKFYFK